MGPHREPWHKCARCAERIVALETEGLTTSDAQGVAEAEHRAPRTLELQLWNPKAKAYEPTGATVVGGNRADVEAMADSARGKGGGWRICRPDRPTKNPRISTPRYTASSRSVEDVQRDYLAWAQAANRTRVTAYGRLPNKHLFTGEIVYTTPDEQFAVSEEHDV